MGNPQVFNWDGVSNCWEQKLHPDWLLKSTQDLAMSMWQKHYKQESPNFEALNDLPGVISQIDNMVCGLTRNSSMRPVGWAITGCSRIYFGEFAEVDAKAEAKRCGGTCSAYQLFTPEP